MSLLNCIFLITLRPYKTPKLNHVEILNEILILIMSDIYFLFTDIVTDRKV
jgi:hypothetical protein